MLKALDSIPPADLPHLLEAWINEHPLSEVISKIELQTRLIEIHARKALAEQDFEGYPSINALMVRILDAIRTFEQETERRIDNDELEA